MRAPILLSCAAVLGCVYALHSATVSQPVVGHRSAPLLRVDGLQFKDLNRNGKLDKDEDWRQPPEVRGADLVGQMSIEDMAGVMVHATLPVVGGANATIGRGSGGQGARLHSGEFTGRGGYRNDAGGGTI